MINDSRIFEIDNNMVVFEQNGEEVLVDVGDTQEEFASRIKLYIKLMKISSVGTTIVHANARDDKGAPSGEGTMMNLYRLFKLFYQREANEKAKK